jgi:hypothetical protein
MTEQHQMVFQKYGLLGAITTVIAVSVAILVQLVVISKWTGAIEEQARATCRRIDVLEVFKESASSNYTTRHEHEDFKAYVERLSRARDESEKRLSDALINIDKKLDEHMKEFRSWNVRH